MHLSLLLLLATAASDGPVDDPVSDPAPSEESRPCEEVEETQEGVEALKREMLGLEFFLRDKKEHKKYCPSTEWKQPKLKKYISEPASYLPEKCKD
jgi:hypothetical protein